jgi:CTP:molybdopterin cytidylyltransferase MocA
MALRLLSQDLRAELRSDFEGHDATQGLLATGLDGTPRVSQLSDLSMVIVLADQPQDVQVWMEQVHSAAPAVPITFLMPQEAEPIVQPYLRLPNVYHLAGLQGALALNALTAGTDSAAIAHATGQQSLAVLAFVILLIGGGLGLALARLRTSRRGAA